MLSEDGSLPPRHPGLEMGRLSYHLPPAWLQSRAGPSRVSVLTRRWRQIMISPPLGQDGRVAREVSPGPLQSHPSGPGLAKLSVRRLDVLLGAQNKPCFLK
eukprot:2163167-Pyramimonas_sp.AAC.1